MLEVYRRQGRAADLAEVPLMAVAKIHLNGIQKVLLN